MNAQQLACYFCKFFRKLINSHSQKIEEFAQLQSNSITIHIHSVENATKKRKE